MKKLILTLALLFVGLTINAQCLPDGYAFKTQIEIDSFYVNYPGCTEILGDVVINGPDITNLDGFNVLTKFGGNLGIQDNHDLTSIEGLINVITIVGDLKIIDNPYLNTLQGLNKLDSVGGDIEIIHNYYLYHLTGLDNLEYTNNVSIMYNTFLQNIIGINLVKINGDLTIMGNNTLLGFLGFDSLKTITGDFKIFDNQALKSIVGMNNLDSIGGALWVYHNQNFEDFQGLENLRYVNFIKLEQNNSLKTLEALENIDPLYLDSLFIWKNRALSICAVNSICAFLNDHMYNKHYIYDNALGCGNSWDIIFICNCSISKIDFNKISIYPNPAKTQFIIENENVIKMDKITIYNVLGQKLLEANPDIQTYIINSSNYIPGMYFVRIVFENLQYLNEIIIIENF